ncbi:hypothetical protein [Methanobrevibacter sp.]|uniref:hypothetical protein n=1 Tax=Methanobrevibacter sp. TaxID=66852 RepID=UPI00386ED7DA
MKKGIVILTLLILALFSISCIYASDVNDTLAVSEDTAAIEVAQSEIDEITANDESQAVEQCGDDEIVNAETDPERLSESEGNYTDLRNDIGNGGNLTKSYYRYYDGDGDTIEITTPNIVINGNGAVIDMSGESIRAFYVNASGVTIKNLTIKNVNYHRYGGGGAIRWDNYCNNGSVVGCSFVNCSSNGAGGAIRWDNYCNNGSVVGCSFVNCSSGIGGAIRWGGSEGNISGCSFVNCSSQLGGGAIQSEVSWGDDRSVSGCSFVNCSSNGAGGAIIWSPSSTSPIYGGLIYNCSFRNCRCDNSVNGGGAICWRDKAFNGSVVGCSFVNCSSDDDGGAISWNANYGTISECNFVNCVCSPFAKGASITFYSFAENCFLLNSTFRHADLIVNDEMSYLVLTLEDNIFYREEIDGIVLYTSNNLGYWNGSAYVENPQSQGIIKSANQLVRLDIYNSEWELVEVFTNLTDSNGQIVYDYSKLDNDAYTYNILIEDKYIIGTGSFNVNVGDFNRLKRIIDMAQANTEVNLTRNFTFIEGLDNNMTNGIIIDKPITINGNGYTIDAKGKACVFYVGASDVTIKNITIKNAHYNGGGGAIYWSMDSGNGSVSNCIFINNTAGMDGGAIYWYGGNGSVSNCIFINNTAGGVGGAIFCSGEFGNISYCVFLNNSADDEGDAIYGIKDIVAYYCWFGNNATNYNESLPLGYHTYCYTSLFLNATANPNVVPAFNTSEIVFKLYLYNATSGNTSEFDNTLLLPVNLTITSANGYVDNPTANLGDSIRYVATGVGIGSLTATFETVQFTIGLNNIMANPNLSAEDQVATYGENATIALNYNGNATGKVNITLTGKKGTFTYLNIDLNATIMLPDDIPADEYNVTVAYSGDVNFFNATARGTLTVKPIIDLSVNITSDKEVYFLGDVCVWTVTVHNAANGTDATEVKLGDLLSTKFVYISSFTNNGTYDNHDGIWEIGLMGNGTDATLIIYAYANATYPNIVNEVVVYGDEDEWNYVNNWDYNYVGIIDLPNVNKTVSNDNPNYNEEILFNLTITNNATVNYTGILRVVDSLPVGLEFVGTESITGADLWLPENVNGQNVTWYITNITKDAPAVITVRLKVTGCGDLTNNMEICSLFGHNKTVGCTVNVPKIKTQLTAEAITTTYNIDKNLVITLMDSQGNPISGVKLTVNLNGAKTLTTDKNGQVKVSTKGLIPKTYTAAITFDGDNNYVKSTASVKVTVNKAKPKIIAKKKTYKAKKKTKKFTITLQDNKGKLIKNAKVRLIVKKIKKTSKKKTSKKSKKKYKTNIVKTNKKGKATFKVKKSKKGKYQGKIIYKGNKYYTKVVKKVKIIIK